jgi:hypothetical protein
LNYVSYNEWIKAYKSCLMTTIPYDIARQWLERASNIEQRIFANIARWKKEGRKS